MSVYGLSDHIHVHTLSLDIDKSFIILYFTDTPANLHLFSSRMPVEGSLITWMLYFKVRTLLHSQ